MSERFYVDGPLAPGNLTLEGPEAHHLRAVCRLGAGDQVSLFNGDGREYPARVERVERRAVELLVGAALAAERELGFSLELAAPLPKGDRAQFLIEKLTELGVTTFVPLKCQRSLGRHGENHGKKMRRWVIEASKQCGRNVLMNITAVSDWSDYARHEADGRCRALAHVGKTGTFAQAYRTWHDLPRERGLRLAVGPEGGFTDDEASAAVAAGWSLLDLGPRTLRVETAALALAAWASLSPSAERK